MRRFMRDHYALLLISTAAALIFLSKHLGLTARFFIMQFENLTQEPVLLKVKRDTASRETLSEALLKQLEKQEAVNGEEELSQDAAGYPFEGAEGRDTASMDQELVYPTRYKE